MNWQTGPARCRSDEYEAEIGIVDGNKAYGRVKRKNWTDWNAARWDESGICLSHCGDETDLLPPSLSLEEAARECYAAYWKDKGPTSTESMLAALQHFIKMQEDGRV